MPFSSRPDWEAVALLLLAAAEESSFTRAAATIGTSQSALSYTTPRLAADIIASGHGISNRGALGAPHHSGSGSLSPGGNHHLDLGQWLRQLTINA
jgi:hypothetical protein